MPPETSTVIQAQANAPLCNSYCAWLQFFVYAVDPGGKAASPTAAAMPADTDVPPQFHKQVFTDTLQNWTLKDQKVEDNTSGLKAQRWDPKQTGQGKVSTCAPVIVYRGSRKVFTDIAVYVMITVYGMATIKFLLMPAADAKGPPATGCRFTVAGFNVSGVKAANFGPDPDTQRANFVMSNWQETVLVDDSAWVQMPGANDFISIPVHISLKASLWAGRDGDWANNITQGMGQYSQLYQNGVSFARKQVEDILNSSAGKPSRVLFSGHSLGGGVASAAAEQIAFEYEKVKTFFIRGLTFNSAGLNPKTLSPGAGLRQAPVNIYSVKDEVLTTLQSFPNDMPIIPYIFRMTGKSLPPAVTNLTRRPGLNPEVDGYLQFNPPSHSKSPPSPGSPLPVLFPLSLQTYVVSRQLQGSDTVQSKWPAISILNFALDSKTVLEFAQKLVQTVHDKYFEEARQATATPVFTVFSQTIEVANVVSIYKYAFSKAFATLGPELGDIGALFTACTQYHLMAAVAQTFDKVKLN